MQNHHPTTQTMNIADLKKHLASLIDGIQQKRSHVLVEMAGIPVAAIVSADDLAPLTRRDKEWEELAHSIARAPEAL